MGLFSKLRAQFIDIIQWEDMADGVLVHRFDRADHEIKMGAQLIVRPGQRAVFVNEGRIADSFEPGTHTLQTQNMPVLSDLMGWKYGFESPFKAEVYFIKTTEQLDRKWGTPNPVMMRDADFGMVRIRARGNYSYKIGLSSEMISRFVGAQAEFTNEDIEGQAKTKVVSSFSDCVAEMKIPALELASQYDEIGDAMKNKLKEEFERIGLDILAFTVANISLPEEVEKAMDERASMGALGNLNNYSQYQAANAIREAAQNQGGTGNMMGMMVGGQMGSGLADVLHQESKEQPVASSPTPPPVPSQAAEWFVAVDGKQTGPFTLDQLKGKISKELRRETLVWREGMANWEKAGEVETLKRLFGACPPPLPPQ